jgi:hypothetical protein
VQKKDDGRYEAENEQQAEKRDSLVHLQARRPGGEEAVCVGYVEHVGLDPVTPGADCEEKGVQRVVVKDLIQEEFSIRDS